MANKKKKMKKRLTQAEEFEIMKLVFDKFLWLGVAVMAYGFFLIVSGPATSKAISFLVAGVVILVLFIWLLIREYEILK